eukprot:1185106-Prorocentrum_minimum.AAC.2
MVRYTIQELLLVEELLVKEFVKLLELYHALFRLCRAVVEQPLCNQQVLRSGHLQVLIGALGNNTKQTDKYQRRSTRESQSLIYGRAVQQQHRTSINAIIIFSCQIIDQCSAR